MKKIIYCLIAFLSIQQKVNAQYIKVDNGFVTSAFDNRLDLPLLQDKINRYSIAVGADYLEKDWFYLSSQIGYLTLGGRDKIIYMPDGLPDISITETKGYIHANTTFRAFIKDIDMKFFIGLGPYLNVLAGSRKFQSSFYSDFYKLKTYAGGKGEVGFTYDVRKLRIGVVGHYMLGLTPAASSVALHLKNKNFGGSVSVGYRLK